MDTPGGRSIKEEIADERGQTIIEYGLILTLVSTTLIASLIIFKADLEAFYETLTEAVTAVI